MALRLVNLHKQENFVWDQDPGKGTADETRFQYRALDAYEQAYLQDRLSTIKNMPTPMAGESNADLAKRVETQTEVHRVAIEAMRIACTGFENLEDHEGNPVEYKTEQANIAGKTKMVLAHDIVGGLPVGLCMAFYMELMRANQVQPDTEKNSAPASSPSNSFPNETAAPAPTHKSASGGTTKTP